MTAASPEVGRLVLGDEQSVATCLSGALLGHVYHVVVFAAGGKSHVAHGYGSNADGLVGNGIAWFKQLDGLHRLGGECHRCF